MEKVTSSGKKKIQDSRCKQKRDHMSTRRVEKSRYLDNLKILDKSSMTKKYEDTVESLKIVKQLRERDNNSRTLPIGNYNHNDKNNYLRDHSPCLPYTINTVHLQNPYKSPQRLEGYALRDTHLKGMYRSRESTLRSRYNRNNLATRETISSKNYDQNEEKRESVNNVKTCLKSTEINTIVKQYCLNSTLHGLRYVGDSKLSIVERIFWIISFTAAVLTATYYIWSLYAKWVTSPIIISISPETVSLDDFPFPAVTICNMNNVKKSEAIRIENGENIQEKLLLEDLCNSDNSSVTSNLGNKGLEWNVMRHFMINVSQSCSDMLYYCQWRGNATECDKIFNPTMTDEGICCNFNSVNRNHLFHDPRDWPDLNITFSFAGIDWNPEIGYNEEVPSDTIPLRSSGAGLYYGLTLVLDANIKEYYCSSTASAGFKMLLHSPVETPKIADFGFAVAPGKEVRVIVSPRISTASKNILTIPRKKRKCFFTSERNLRYYRTYTQRNCILECEANFTQEMCNCVQYYMPKSSNTTICGKKDDVCATNARRAMESKLYDDNQFNVTEVPSCNCWPGCFELSYNFEISDSKLMSNFNVQEKYTKKSKKYFTENMAVVHIFFVESQFTKSMKNELFGFTEFLSSTGGLLGLFMGFSFLSFMEILYFLTLRLWCRLKENKSTPSHTVVKVHPMDHDQDCPIYYAYLQFYLNFALICSLPQ
ncbi:PREDICTED: pickpocket protein 28-like [Polistes dominula]|uniref:Pickpocket protein 28-like n=1 Tax=Polistes dominula TaxID=743375 RepID=A0ABM1IGX8_POLDO|nr:PREDICTED: pickpocket protein 28-like [Polistes dominula]XP_015179466.1 PREDICTED: pickpocket protein 28-like [Polistes dominula]